MYLKAAGLDHEDPKKKKRRKWFDMDGAGAGIGIANSSNGSILANNFLNHNDAGIILYHSEKNLIKFNTIKENINGRETESATLSIGSQGDRSIDSYPLISLEL